MKTLLFTHHAVELLKWRDAHLQPFSEYKSSVSSSSQSFHTSTTRKCKSAWFGTSAWDVKPEYFAYLMYGRHEYEQSNICNNNSSWLASNRLICSISQASMYKGRKQKLQVTWSSRSVVLQLALRCLSVDEEGQEEGHYHNPCPKYVWCSNDVEQSKSQSQMFNAFSHILKPSLMVRLFPNQRGHTLLSLGKRRYDSWGCWLSKWGYKEK